MTPAAPVSGDGATGERRGHDPSGSIHSRGASRSDLGFSRGFGPFAILVARSVGCRDLPNGDPVPDGSKPEGTRPRSISSGI